MLIDVASALGYTKCFALPKASAGSCRTCARMYPNSPKVPGLGSGLAELSQLENRISPAKKLHAGSLGTCRCKCSAAVAHLPGLQLPAGSAQAVRRAGRATTAARSLQTPESRQSWHFVLHQILALFPQPHQVPLVKTSHAMGPQSSCGQAGCSWLFSTKAQLVLGGFCEY